VYSVSASGYRCITRLISTGSLASWMFRSYKSWNRQEFLSGKIQQLPSSPLLPRLTPYSGSQTSTVCTRSAETTHARTLRSAANPDK